MKSTFFISIFILMATQAQASSSFSCFSKYYSANLADIHVTGEVVSNNQIKNLRVVSEEEGLKYNLHLAKAITNYNPRKYKGYNLYILGKNPRGPGFQSISMLLPNNISQISGRFDAYVSDSNADSSGSSGYFRVLCQGL